MYAPRIFAATALAVLAAAALAAGCGSSSSGPAKEQAAASKAREEGLAWVADDAVVVARFDVQPKDVDVALDTLDRLPIWAMAKSRLPKGGGDALYAKAINGFLDSDGNTEHLSWKHDVQPWFEGSGGVALVGGADAVGPDAAEGLIAWFDSSDDDAAIKMWRGGSDKAVEHKHGDVTYWLDEGDDQPKGSHIGAFVEDGVLVAGTEPALKRAIDVHDSGDDIAGSQETLAVLDGAQDGMQLAVVVRTNPLLEAGRRSLDAMDEPDGSPRLARLPGQAAHFIASKEMDNVLPDVVGLGAAFDDVGLRTRVTWSNPDVPASSKLEPRELVERFPAGVVTASARVSDPADLQPFFALLDEGLADFEVRPNGLPAQCPVQARAWCNLGVTLLTMLQDDDLREQLTSGDPRTTALAQTMDIAGMLKGAGLSGPGASPDAGPGSAYLYAGEHSDSGSRMVAVFEDERLVNDLRAVGLSISAKKGSLAVRVLPGSSLAASLHAITPEQAAGFSATGIDLAALAAGRPVTFNSHRFEDLDWATFPPAAEATMRASIEDGDDTLGEGKRYQATLDVLDPPKDPASWTWIDYGVLVEDLDQLGPTVAPYAGVVEQNFEHVGGFVGWSSVDEFAGRDVGVVELTLPILE